MANPTVALPEGAQLLTEVITPDEEKAMYAEINAAGWQSLGCARAVQEYGYNYHFRRCGTEKFKDGLVFKYRESYNEYIQTVGFGQEIDTEKSPAFVEVFMQLVRDWLDRPLNQIIVNRYLPGEGIKNHRDTDMPCRWFCSLSLGAGITLKFVYPEREDDRFNVWLPRRSLLLAEGPAFFEYKHGISHKKHDGHIPREPRISMTGRFLSPDDLK